MSQILVTGAHGQLGQEIMRLEKKFPQHEFIGATRTALDITNEEQVAAFFKKKSLDIVINCAAYTKVDKAEAAANEAHLVNEKGTENIAKACSAHNCLLIHISTDFVFDGSKGTPYKEDDDVQPTGVYAKSKLAGEQAALQHSYKTIIIRTAWVYAAHGHNFVKTMLRLGKKLPEIGVVYDQIGCPTYTEDLALAILNIIDQPAKVKGGEIYHFSNKGVLSWYDFAVAIMELSGSECKVNPIETWQYPTPAKRPTYSVLSTVKIREHFGVETPYWRDSLKRCLEQIDGG